MAHSQNEKLFTKISNYKPAVYYIAASLFLLIGSVTIWLPEHVQDNHHLTNVIQTKIVHTKTMIEADYGLNQTLSPRDAANMYEKYEWMRHGTCQFSEVLAIPDKDKAIYLENVVGGELPKNPDDMAIANFYLEKVRCHYSPFLNTNSAS